MASEIHDSQVTSANRRDPGSFYRRRKWVSMGLLIFVVAVGLPIVGFPFLRHRLSGRVMMLKSALAGEIKPATLEVGANRTPFPAEYEKAHSEIPKLALPQQAQNLYAPRPATPRSAPGIRNFQVLPPPAKSAKSEETPDQPDAGSAQSQEPQLKYQKGQAEQDAYDLLLKSVPAAAGLVQGKDPSLKFKSWDAANRGDDNYWVRLTFQKQGNPDEEYIWQVNMQSKDVKPMSYAARSIS